MTKLTVTVITYNEGPHIVEALQSVSWADEIILVDSHSTDDTVAKARPHATRVEVRDWTGYGTQKNYAAALASHDWILSVDADERVTPALAEEIQALLRAGPGATGYQISRVSNYLGQWIPHRWYRLPRPALPWGIARGATTVHWSLECEGRVVRPRGSPAHHYRNVYEPRQIVGITAVAEQWSPMGGRSSAGARSSIHGGVLRNMCCARLQRRATGLLVSC